MNDKEAIDMMNRTEAEVTQLRAIVDRLQPKADAYDLLAQLMGHIGPNGNQARGGEVDFLWTLRRERQKLTESMSLDKAADVGPVNGNNQSN